MTTLFLATQKMTNKTKSRRIIHIITISQMISRGTSSADASAVQLTIGKRTQKRYKASAMSYRGDTEKKPGELNARLAIHLWIARSMTTIAQFGISGVTLLKIRSSFDSIGERRRPAERAI